MKPSEGNCHTFGRLQLWVLIFKFEKTSYGPDALETKKIHFIFGVTKQVKYLNRADQRTKEGKYTIDNVE